MTRLVYPSERNKGFSSTFQPPEEGRSVQRPKRCDKYGDKDDDNSPNNVNNVHHTSSQKYRQISDECIHNYLQYLHADKCRCRRYYNI